MATKKNLDSVSFDLFIEIYAYWQQTGRGDSIGQGFCISFPSAAAAAAFLEGLGDASPNGLATQYASEVREYGPLVATLAKHGLSDEAINLATDHSP